MDKIVRDIAKENGASKPLPGGVLFVPGKDRDGKACRAVYSEGKDRFIPCILDSEGKHEGIAGLGRNKWHANKLNATLIARRLVQPVEPEGTEPPAQS